MATYYVNSGAGGTNAGTSWTNAYTAFGSAVTAATSAGDIILVHYLHQEELGVDTTYTFGASNIFIISVDKDSSDAPTAMGTGGWIGNSTTNRSIALASTDFKIVFSGITFRTAGSTSDHITLASSTGSHQEFLNCYLWSSNTHGTSQIKLGSGNPAYAKLINCTFRFGATGQNISVASRVDLIGCVLSSAGSTPTTLFASVASEAAMLSAEGCDFSLVTGTLVPNSGLNLTFNLSQCKLGAGVTILASQTTNPTKGSPVVFVNDCHSGDTHLTFGYYDGLGSLLSDTSIYFTSGVAGQSWKIVTTSNVTKATPFVSPWIDLYHSGTSAITPYLEILRDGSTTAYKDDEVWAEFTAKTTSNITQSTYYSDMAAINVRAAGTGSSQASGAGLGSWTGESGTAWSGKCDSGSSFTPTEVGYIRARVSIAAASATVYIDPQIRT